jgi:anti-sigma factor RsiW
MSDPKIPQATRCLDDNTIAAFVAGEASELEAEALRAHLDACPACHALAASVARTVFTAAAEADGDLGVAGTVSAEADLSRLLARGRARIRPGSLLGRYVVGEALGEGGMGTVYIARDPELARNVALKVVAHAALDSDAQRKRLVREARAAAQLQHPNVVTIFDVGQIEEATYLAMELVAGKSLRAYVGDAAVPVARRVGWLIDVAKALDVAHAHGLVHRDIKPENVMVRSDGVIKVVDFGIARRLDLHEGDPREARTHSTVTDRDAVVGTPMYMAPEQLRGEAVDARCDQFAWGVLAYELLTGVRPWSGKGLSLVSQILSADLPRLALAGGAAVPPALEAIVRRATAKVAGDRFGGMGEVVRALGEAGGRAPRAKRSGAWLAVAGVVLVVGAALAVRARAREGTRAATVTATTTTTTTATATATTTATATATTTATTTAMATATATSLSDVATTGAPPPRPGRPSIVRPPPSARSPSCDPPFTWRAGVKIPKPECPLD